jgi:hypothetical protein
MISSSCLHFIKHANHFIKSHNNQSEHGFKRKEKGITWLVFWGEYGLKEEVGESNHRPFQNQEHKDSWCLSFLSSCYGGDERDAR